jgi:hypothetical protein
MSISDCTCPQKLGDSSSRRFGKWTSFVADREVIEIRVINLIHDPLEKAFVLFLWRECDYFKKFHYSGRISHDHERNS